MCFADCDFKTGIEALPDGRYAYSRDCHLQVGSMKKQIANQQQQISDLNQAITLKDLALVDSQKQADLWKSTSLGLQDRLQTVNQMQKTNDFLYFSIGIVSTIATGFAISSLVKHQ